ncbi:hypothetical protein Tco_1338548 [Tanacetum coccineum]
MDNVRPRGSYSPIKRSYYTKPTFRPKDLKQDVKTFRVQNMTTTGTRAVVNTCKGKIDTDLKKSRWVWRPKGNYLDQVSKDSGSFMLKKVEYVDPKGISKYITVKVAGKPVNISEASIRSDLFFDDADGIDSLHNQAIFDAIQQMGSKSTSWDQIPTNIATIVICLATNQKYNFSKLNFDGMMRHLDAKKKFVMYPRFIPVFLTNQLKNVPVPLDHFPINALTPKVFSFMVKKQKHFLGNVTPLFESMLAHTTEDEGVVSERPSETQPTPSPPHPKGSGGNHGGQSSSDRSLSGNKNGLTLQSIYDLYVSLCKQVTTQAAQIKDLKSQIKQLKKKAKPVISHHNAWIKSVSIKKRLARKKSLKNKLMQKEFISKQGRKPAKSEPTVHKDPDFDDLDDIVDDAMDYMETEDAQDEGRTSYVVLEDKESVEKGVSTKDQVSTIKADEGTDKPKVSTDKPEVSIAKPKEVEVSTDKLDESTVKPKDGTSDESTAPTTVFRDDETNAEFLVSMSQNKAKQKGVEIKDAEDSDRPRATSTRSLLTLKPLPKIDPKDKGKKVLEEEAESDAESEGVDEAKRKFDQLSKDEEIAKKVQEDWEAEEEMKKLAEEEDTKADLIQDFDDIQVKIEADRLLAARIQEEERETFTVEKRAKFIYDIIAAQRRFIAQQRAATIRSRPPTRTQLRNQMMTYLKHVGGKKHADLKNKNFEEIQVLYKEVNRSDKNFIAIGSAKDERQIKEMNEESKDPKRKRLKKRVVNETSREEDTAKLHKVSSPDGDYLVVHRVNGHFRAFNYLMEGDLKIMMESSTEANDQELKDGTVVYILVERRYPLSKELLQRMLDLGLEVDSSFTYI